MLKILIVEDDLALSAGLCFALDEAGYCSVAAYTCEAARRFWQDDSFHLAILDVRLPDGSGFDLCREMKASAPERPVIFLTARGEAEDKIEGLTLGADDYMVKPFLPKEFLLRVTALLRRTYGNILPENGFFLPDPDCGKREIRFDTALVLRGEEEIPLTPKELILLKVLYGQKNRIVTSDALTMAAWGDTSYGYENTLMVHIRRLRQKIETDPSSPKHLLTVKGLGYKLVVKPPAAG